MIRRNELPKHVLDKIDDTADVNAAIPKPRAEKPRRNKYNARRTEYNGVTYDSKAEARRAAELDARAHARIERQPVFDLSGVKYRADFKITDADTGDVHIEDVKGRETGQFKTVRKLWLRHGPHPLHVLKDTGEGRWFTEIIPGAK